MLNRAQARDVLLVSPRFHRPLRRLSVSLRCRPARRGRCLEQYWPLARPMLLFVLGGTSTEIPGLTALRFPPRKRGGASVISVDPNEHARALRPCEDGSGCDEIEGTLRSPQR